jgi:predicted alpha-1,2-mannosidase
MKKFAFIFTLVFLLQNVNAQVKDPVDLVYPLLDAANSRWFYFSSACRPFGLVSLFPDNNVSGDWNGGYRYNIDTVKDFSHVHEWQLSGVATMPVVYDAGELPGLFRDYASHFSHQSEVVRPGYHKVILDRYGIGAELTATSRAGFHRYRFPSGKQKGVLFELCGTVLGPSKMIEGGFVQTSDTEIRGYMANGPTGRRPKTYNVYFSAVFNQPIKKIWLWDNGVIKEGIKNWDGKRGKIIVELADQASKSVLMKVGVSYTSEAGAANNLQKEMPQWQFDKIVSAARDEWNQMLGRITVEGGGDQQQRRFYTDLWHSIQGRRIINDIDGKYADFTGTERIIKQIPQDNKGRLSFNMYNSDSFWGAQWTLNCLWQLVYPEIAEDFCKSFLEYYKNGGLIPRGPAGGNYTFVMTGDQLAPFFVAAWQKGIRGFDINLAYEGLRKNHLPGGIMSKVGYEHKTSRGGGLEFYIDKGYVPYPLSDTSFGLHQDGAAITLENAYQDWCLAQLALKLNKQDDYNYFKKRSENYRNLYNSPIGYMAPKNREGKWKDPYDPLQYEKGFEEGNGAQFTWFVPHDLEGLFQLMGGKDTAVAKLNRAFTMAQPFRFSDEHPEKSQRIVNNRRLAVNYSNQPSIQTAFIFNHAGAPWLTQYWSRMVIDSAFSSLSPYYGYNGDEDQGLMGSLNVLMKTGLFQMTGGCEEDPVYDIGSPIFDKITIALNPDYYKARNFIIETKNNSSKNKYIKKAWINGKLLETFFIHHSNIKEGSKLVLEMTDEPVKTKQ